MRQNKETSLNGHDLLLYLLRAILQAGLSSLGSWIARPAQDQEREAVWSDGASVSAPFF